MSVLTLVLCLQLLACAGSVTSDRSSAGVTVEALATQVLSEAPQSVAPLILDVRSAEEYAAGHIPGAVNIDYRQVTERIDSLQDYKNREVIVYCEQGVRASKAEAVLLEAGFAELRHLEGDMVAWREALLPIEVGR